MLVVVSDWHLTDATCTPTLPAGAMRVLGERLQDLAIRASWRADGRYRPVEAIDLLVNGDLFDFTRSTRWLTSSIRPWDSAESPAFGETIAAIAGDIVRQNAESLALLRALAEGAIRVPLANLAGQPAPGEGQPIAVRIHYLVGNTDWYLRLPGAKFDAIRRQLLPAMALAARPDAILPHDPAESDSILEVQRQHRVVARHGDIFDPLSYREERSQASASDALALELVTRYVAEASRELGDQLPPAALAGLRELHHLRPQLLATNFLTGMLERTCASPTLRAKAKRIWDRMVEDVLSLSIWREGDREGSSLLELAAKALRGASAESVRHSLNELRGAHDDSYACHALFEPEFRNRRARYIVYGHTHAAETVPLDASFADGFVLNQMYCNTGTFRRVYRATQSPLARHEFIPADSLSLLALYQGDERQGRSLESWSGMLSVHPAEGVITRFDGAQAGVMPAMHGARVGANVAAQAMRK